jgi:hypothetical protein
MNLFDVSSISPGEDTVFQLAKGSAILLGVFTTLIYFHFGAHQTLGQAPSRPKWLGALAWVGQIFIAITLGAMFAGVYSAALTALIERVTFIRNFIFALIAA